LGRELRALALSHTASVRRGPAPESSVPNTRVQTACALTQQMIGCIKAISTCVKSVSAELFPDLHTVSAPSGEERTPSASAQVGARCAMPRPRSAASQPLQRRTAGCTLGAPLTYRQAAGQKPQGRACERFSVALFTQTVDSRSGLRGAVLSSRFPRSPDAHLKWGGCMMS